MFIFWQPCCQCLVQKLTSMEDKTGERDFARFQLNSLAMERCESNFTSDFWNSFYDLISGAISVKPVLGPQTPIDGKSTLFLCRRIAPICHCEFRWIRDSTILLKFYLRIPDTYRLLNTGIHVICLYEYYNFSSLVLQTYWYTPLL